MVKSSVLREAWFTGHIIVSLDELVEYVQLDYASTFESYTVVTVHGWLLTRRM